MDSKEALNNLKEINRKQNNGNGDIWLESTIIEPIEKDLELLEKYKRVMCEPILDIMKELKQLDKIKVLLVDYNNGKLGYINFTQEVIEVLTND